MIRKIQKNLLNLYAGPNSTYIKIKRHREAPSYDLNLNLIVDPPVGELRCSVKQNSNFLITDGVNSEMLHSY